MMKYQDVVRVEHGSGYSHARFVTSADAAHADKVARQYASHWTIVGNVFELAGYCLVDLVVHIAPRRQIFGRVALLNTFLIEEIL